MRHDVVVESGPPPAFRGQILRPKKPDYLSWLFPSSGRFVILKRQYGFDLYLGPSFLTHCNLASECAEDAARTPLGFGNVAAEVSAPAGLALWSRFG